MPYIPNPDRPPGGLCSPWATTADVCAPCDDIDVELLDGWLEVSSSILFELTGRRWPGECTEIVYPTGRECMEWLGVRNGMPYAPKRKGLRLPGYPVVEIEEVKIDGVVVDPDRYRVDDSRWLVYLPPVPYSSGDRQSWPFSNDASLALDSEGTWSVEYIYGTMPPPGGKEAAAALGCQLALSCSPDAEGTCRLPERVTSITRQGITMAILDPLTLFSEGRTGLVEVDMWIEAQRLGVARRPAGLVLPGRRPSVRRSSTL